MTTQSRDEFEEKLINMLAAASDPQAARAKLISNPKAAFEDLLGMELPEEVKIAVHEEDANTLHFVLPPVSDELNAAELAAVSGGACWDNCGDQSRIGT